MKKNLFLSESHIGNHVAPDFFEADLLSFTYYPVPEIHTYVTGIEHIYPKISYGKVFMNGKSIADEVKKTGGNIFQYIFELMKNRKYLFVGFDLDLMGQIMSSIIYYDMISRGIDPNRIIRVPLSDEGYISGDDHYYFSFSDFYDYDTLIDMLEAIRIEQSLIWKERVGHGFRKMEIIKELLNKPDSFKRRNLETNTITYCTKYLIEESGD